LYRVEFIGLPGAGKSTVRKALIDRLRAASGDGRYFTVEEAYLHGARLNMDKVFRYFLKLLPGSAAIKLSNKLVNRSLMHFEAQNRFLANYGKALGAFFSSHVFNEMSIDDRQSVISAFLEVGAFYESVNALSFKNPVVFFEEGLVQKSLMFVSPSGSYGKDMVNLETYLDEIPLPEILIYVKSDIETCSRRMLSRPEGLTRRLKNADAALICEFLKKTDRHLQEVASRASGNTSCAVIEINNNGKLEDNIDCLERRMREITKA